jgi:hypothetical protein
MKPEQQEIERLRREVNKLKAERDVLKNRRIVPDVAGSAHAANDAAVGHQPLELIAGVLAAAV